MFGQLRNGGNILSSRDDGLDLRDSEGWCRFRCCGPLTVRDRMALDDKGFLGFPGDLVGTRHTLASTNDRPRFFLDDNWRSHQQGLVRTLAVMCLDKTDTGIVKQECDWQSTYFIG